MILVDTNVISEIMRVSPSENVLDWLNVQKSASLYISSITIGEIEFGLRLLPAGKRQLQLRERFERFVALAFAHRVLAFDEAAARSYGEIMSYRRAIGRSMSVPDGQIAGIASSNGLAVATRNISDFEACGVDLLNPFLSESRGR
jgi:predicted nucleic acid-binding protein